jgi:hypothetical protein
MRYTLHNASGEQIGESETVQGICDLATHATFSVDSRTGMAFPFTVFEKVDGHINGTMYGCETDAMDAMRKLK